jgi:hypothetical protein
MKNLRFAILFVAFIAAFSNSFSQEPRNNISGDFILKTQWGDQFNCKFTPGNEPLGCHSIAIAQVLYHHRLAPSGSVNYKCSNGLVVNEDFSDYIVDWDKISARLTESSSKEAIDATAYYNFAVAAIVQKDFATDNYIGIENSNNHKTQVEEHFKCKYESYTYHNPELIKSLFSDKTFEQIVKKEIDGKRPLGFYYIWDQGGHAVAVDGYTEKEGKFYVHANFGWMGHSDGWYLLPDDLPPTTQLILLLTMDPVRQ